MSKIPNQQGFVPLVIPLIVFVSLATLVAASLQTQMSTPNSSVQGVFLARGGDDSGGSSSGSSGSGGGSEDSNKTPEAQKTPEPVEVENKSDDRGSNQPNTLNRRVKNEVKDKNEIKDETENEVEDQGFKLKVGEIGLELKFPLSISSTSGQLMVRTPNGLRAIRVLPSQAASIATQEGIIKKLEGIELSENTQTQNQEFIVKGQTSGKLFGFIPVVVPVTTRIDSQTGSLLSTEEPFWFKFLSRFITQ